MPPHYLPVRGTLARIPLLGDDLRLCGARGPLSVCGAVRGVGNACGPAAIVSRASHVTPHHLVLPHRWPWTGGTGAPASEAGLIVGEFRSGGPPGTCYLMSAPGAGAGGAGASAPPAFDPAAMPMPAGAVGANPLAAIAGALGHLPTREELMERRQELEKIMLVHADGACHWRQCPTQGSAVARTRTCVARALRP